MNKRKSYLLVVAALGIAVIALGAGIAAAEKPVITRVGAIETEFNGGFTPIACRPSPAYAAARRTDAGSRRARRPRRAR